MRISPLQALQRIPANGMMKAKGKASPIEFIRPIGDAGESLYVFRNGDKAILTTADDELQPVIAYCDNAAFDDGLPPALHDWLMEYAHEVEWWQRCGRMAEMPTGADVNERVTTATLIDLPWKQTAPFNGHLKFKDTECVVGCNALSMAMIFYYWGKQGYHRGCPQVPGYTTSSNKYKVEALKTINVFDYSNISDKAKGLTAKQAEAVATLCEYMGKAIQSDYTASNTTAYPSKVAAALRQMRMGNCNMIYASTLGAEKFEQTIYEEITAHRPVILTGYGSSGHTFVCHGYDSAKDMYDMNWGWGGKYNGKYAMSALKPSSSYNFSSNKRAVIGIQPTFKLGDANGDGNVDSSDVMQVVNNILNDKYDERADINLDGKNTVTDAMIIVNHITGKDSL